MGAGTVASSSRPRLPCATLPLCPPHSVTRGSPPRAELSPDATHDLAGLAQRTPALSAWDMLDGTGTRASPSGGQGGFLRVLTQRGREERPVVAQRASTLSVHSSGTAVRAGPSPLSQT